MNKSMVALGGLCGLGSLCLGGGFWLLRAKPLGDRHARKAKQGPVSFSWNSFLKNSGMDLCSLLEALGAVFLIF